MDKILAVMMVIALLSFSSGVYSAKNETGSQGVAAQGQQQIVSPTDNQVKNQNQVETQNQGEESQLNVNTQEQENLEESLDDQSGIKNESSRSATAKENMSNVSEKVEELLVTKTEQGGIGEEVKQVAQEQKQAQDQIKTDLEKVDKRGGLLKSIIGPDYQALKNMQKQVEQNRLRIQLFEQLMTQLNNQNEITMVQETIQLLTDQNTALQDKIVLEEKTVSILGWFLKLFAR